MRRIVPVIALALAVATCDPTGNTQVADGGAWFRFDNQVVDANPTNILVNGIPLVTSVAFNTTTDRTPIATGQQVLIIRQASPDFLIASDTISPVDFRRYSLYGIGQLNAFKALLAVDDTIPADAGKYKVRFVHGIGSEAAFSIDFYTDTTSSLASATATATGIGYGSLSGYVSVDTALHRLRIARNGNTTAMIDTTLGSFSSGSVITIVGSNIQGGGTNKFLKVVADTIP